MSDFADSSLESHSTAESPKRQQVRTDWLDEQVRDTEAEETPVGKTGPRGVNPLEVGHGSTDSEFRSGCQEECWSNLEMEKVSSSISMLMFT